MLSKNIICPSLLHPPEKIQKSYVFTANLEWIDILHPAQLSKKSHSKQFVGLFTYIGGLLFITVIDSDGWNNSSFIYLVLLYCISSWEISLIIFGMIVIVLKSSESAVSRKRVIKCPNSFDQAIDCWVLIWTLVLQWFKFSRVILPLNDVCVQCKNTLIFIQ